jgi:protein-disulfide isomerase
MKRIVVVGVAVLVVALGIGLWVTQGGNQPSSTGADASSGLGTPLKDAVRTAVYQADGLLPEAVQGSATAPLTVIEYASLTCPHCAAFQRETLPSVKTDYVETGKVKLIYRDFPLDNLAMGAALLAHCSGPDRYFGFVEILFRSQTTWVMAQNPRQELIKVARLANMSNDQAEACLADDKLLKAIQERAKTASEKFGVDSTPTFFVGNRKVSGEIPYADFKKILDAEMPK